MPQDKRARWLCLLKVTLSTCHIQRLTPHLLMRWLLRSNDCCTNALPDNPALCTMQARQPVTLRSQSWTSSQAATAVASHHQDCMVAAGRSSHRTSMPPGLRMAAGSKHLLCTTASRGDCGVALPSDHKACAPALLPLMSVWPSCPRRPLGLALVWHCSRGAGTEPCMAK